MKLCAQNFSGGRYLFDVITVDGMTSLKIIADLCCVIAYVIGTCVYSLQICKNCYIKTNPYITVIINF